jgi:hypothetical protein
LGKLLKLSELKIPHQQSGADKIGFEGGEDFR